MTVIEWTDTVWNPVVGCSKVSEGCRNCYAFELHDRRHKAYMDGNWPNAPKQYYKPFSSVQLLSERLLMPLKWRTHKRVFVNSMSDLFHQEVPNWYIDEVFGVILACNVLSNKPNHVFQILTKRPERMNSYFAAGAKRLLERWSKAMDGVVIMSNADVLFSEYVFNCFKVEELWPLSNLWLGTSVENQKAADERIPLLLQTPAAIRFLSCEPLLGPVDLNAVPRPDNAYFSQRGETGCITDPSEPDDYVYWHKRDQINWLIAGGESGRNARPMHPEWVISLREQCQAAGVPFFFKQWGEWAPIDQPWKQDSPKSLSGNERWLNNEGGHGFHGNEVWRMRRIGKKKAGRLLDGREWNEMPVEEIGMHV